MSVLGRPVVLSAMLLAMVGPVMASEIGPETFIAATADIKARGIEPLAQAVDANPRGIAALLESEIGGRKALQLYATAILEAGEEKRLGAQWAVVARDEKALAKAENKDGGVWYPLAEDAGFFSGGILAVLEQRAEAIPAFSAGAGIEEPSPGQDLMEWLEQQVALPGGPARNILKRAMRAGAVR